MSRPRGRRPANQDTRSLIVETARAEFAERGYDAATLRGIARRASVDPALLHHYFKGKAGLFAEVIAMPIDTRRVVASIVDGPPDQVGERIVRTFLSIWDAPESRDRFTTIVRSALSNEQAAAALREFITRELLVKIAAQSGAKDARLRATMAASQMVGIALVRYIVKVKPLATASVDEIVALVGPSLQAYLAP